MDIHQAVIIAAGRGIRFGETTNSRPKPLIELAGIPLLSRILASVKEACIEQVTVVTGYQAELLDDFLRTADCGMRISTVHNKKWRDPNGWSVLSARGHVRSHFALLMSDHIFEPLILKKLSAAPLPAGFCRLAVDFHPEKVPDLEDATKVAVEAGMIRDIGKNIAQYNAIDTGIFLFSDAIFPALERAFAAKRESLSDGILELARDRRMEALDIGDLFWRDIDDERALREAEGKLEGGGIL
jgi:choline kinase